MEKYTIGRDSDCDVILADETVSGWHAILQLYPDGSIEIKDQGSLNGTVVRDQGSSYELGGSQSHAVELQSRVQLGHVKLTILDMIAKLIENRPPSLVFLRQYQPDAIKTIQQSNPEIFKEEVSPPVKKPVVKKPVIGNGKPSFDPVTGELKR